MGIAVLSLIFPPNPAPDKYCICRVYRRHSPNGSILPTRQCSNRPMTSAADRLSCVLHGAPATKSPASVHAFEGGTTFRYPTVEALKRAVSREAYMSPNRGSEKSYLRDDSGVRRAARLVIDEFGDTTLDVLHVERRAADHSANMGSSEQVESTGDDRMLF